MMYNLVVPVVTWSSYLCFSAYVARFHFLFSSTKASFLLDFPSFFSHALFLVSESRILTKSPLRLASQSFLEIMNGHIVYDESKRLKKSLSSLCFPPFFPLMLSLKDLAEQL